MFKRLQENDGEALTLELDGVACSARKGDMLSAVLLERDRGSCRVTPVGGAMRAPYCLMGVCFECLVEIDGVPNQQACMTPVQDGMKVRRQIGAADLAEDL